MTPTPSSSRLECLLHNITGRTNTMNDSVNLIVSLKGTSYSSKYIGKNCVKQCAYKLRIERLGFVSF
jgi:hypothetical protein